MKLFEAIHELPHVLTALHAVAPLGQGGSRIGFAPFAEAVIEGGDCGSARALAARVNRSSVFVVMGLIGRLYCFDSRSELASSNAAAQCVGGMVDIEDGKLTGK